MLEALEVDYIDESEVLTPADEAHHIDKWALQGAVRVRRHEPRRGAAAHRRGRGDDPHQGRGRHRQRGRGGAPHARHPRGTSGASPGLDETELATAAKELARRSTSSARWPSAGRLPVVNFSAGGIATPADAALMMQLGSEGVFVGSGIFKAEDPERTGAAIVEATTHFDDARARGRRLARPRAGHGRPRDRRARRAGRRRPDPAPRLVVARAAAASASSPSRVTSRRTPVCSPSSGPSRALGAHPGRPRGPRRARHPRRRVDDDDARHRARGAGRAAARRSSRAGTPMLGTCAGLIMLDRDHLGVLDMRARRNAFGRQVQSSR